MILIDFSGYQQYFIPGHLFDKASNSFDKQAHIGIKKAFPIVLIESLNKKKCYNDDHCSISAQS